MWALFPWIQSHKQKALILPIAKTGSSESSLSQSIAGYMHGGADPRPIVTRGPRTFSFDFIWIKTLKHVLAYPVRQKINFLKMAGNRKCFSVVN